VSAELLRDAPVAFFAFDLLFENGEALFELPLSERLARLRKVVKGGAVRLSDQTPIRDAAHVDELFDASRARANEGLVVKDPGSIYTPGRRGKSWLKYKKALATLDCVVTAAEYGHGKRRGVLSDYTFAVRRDQELVNIGKAYSGLTDVEIDQLTKHFQEMTSARHGPVHLVEPRVVLEIAFDRIQESKRHKSGYALRFPRIAHPGRQERRSDLHDRRSPADLRGTVETRTAGVTSSRGPMPQILQNTFISAPPKQLC
jgi:DNA ligase-1